jgi:hypothetical protein
MKSLLPFLIVSVCASIAQAEEESGRLYFNNTGFSISPLEENSPTDSYTALIMPLMPIDGFAPNVNIQIQPYKGTIQEYEALSVKQFEEFKYNLIQEKASGNSVIFEYSAMMKGRPYHGYIKAELNNGIIYLATGTSTESQWKAMGDKLKACVDSLRAEKTKPAKPPKEKPATSKARAE